MCLCLCVFATSLLFVAMDKRPLDEESIFFEMDCEIEHNYQQLNGSARACSDNLNPHAQREITNFAGGSVSTQFSPNNFMCSFYCSFDIRTI